MGTSHASVSMGPNFLSPDSSGFATRSQGFCFVYITHLCPNRIWLQVETLLISRRAVGPLCFEYPASSQQTCPCTAQLCTHTCFLTFCCFGFWGQVFFFSASKTKKGPSLCLLGLNSLRGPGMLQSRMSIILAKRLSER